MKHVDNQPNIQALRKISSLFATADLEIDQLLSLPIEPATETIGARNSSLLLVDDNSGHLQFYQASGQKKIQLKNFEIPPGMGLAGAVLGRDPGRGAGARDRGAVRCARGWMRHGRGLAAPQRERPVPRGARDGSARRTVMDAQMLPSALCQGRSSTPVPLRGRRRGALIVYAGNYQRLWPHVCTPSCNRGACTGVLITPAQVGALR